MHKSRRWEVYTDVRFSTVYFQKANEKSIFKSGTIPAKQIVADL